MLVIIPLVDILEDVVSKPNKLAEQLRRIIERSGQSRYAISKATGIDQNNLWRFVHGKGGLSMDAIDALMRHFKLELNPKQQRKRKGG